MVRKPIGKRSHKLFSDCHKVKTLDEALVEFLYRAVPLRISSSACPATTNIPYKRRTMKCPSLSNKGHKCRKLAWHSGPHIGWDKFTWVDIEGRCSLCIKGVHEVDGVHTVSGEKVRCVEPCYASRETLTQRNVRSEQIQKG